MSENLRHWHKVGDEPSELAEPPRCCAQAAGAAMEADAKAARKARETAVHAERRRVVTESLRELDSYRASVASVVEPDTLKLIDRVLGAVDGIIRGVGCICPVLEIGVFGHPNQQIRDHDPRCGVHNPEDAR